MPEVWKHRDDCRLCGGKLKSVLDLGTQYLPRFIPTDKVEELQPKLPQAPLRLARCELCGLLQLHEVVESDLVYRDYWYRSSINSTMQTSLLNLVREAQSWHTSGTWLDIGANDGTLLKFVPRTFTRIACEPARNFTLDLAEFCDYVIADYFHADAHVQNVEVITSAAMFYDLDAPDAFVEAIAQTLAPDGIWINQLNDAPSMILANAWDGICHEHNVYYDLPNLHALYLRHGLKILRVSYNDVNGGSMRVTAARKEHRTPAGNCTESCMIPSEQQVLRFALRAVRWKQRMRDLVKALPQPIYGYGASTKGGTLLQYLGLPGFLKAVADRNPLKYGLCQSGIWAPIVSENDMRAANPGTLFVLPWAFRKEFIEREESLRAAGTFMVMPLPNIEIVS